MGKAGNPLALWRTLLIILTAVVVVVADQLTQSWITGYPLGQTIAKFGFIRIIHIQNDGSAFGLFQGQMAIIRIVAAIGVAVLVVAAVWAYRKYPGVFTKWNGIAYGLVMGGAIGNLIDRFRFGYVVDFVDVGFWPVFNIADSGITIGVIMFAITLLRYTLKERKQSPPPAA
jgi:signal peptidase II